MNCIKNKNLSKYFYFKFLGCKSYNLCVVLFVTKKMYSKYN